MLEWIMLVIAVLVFGVLSVAGWWISRYNTLQIATQDIKTQWSNVKTEYQRRADLILNLASTAKGYAKFEKDTFTQVAAARAGLSSKATMPKADEMKKMHMLDNVLSRLMVVVEKYPQLQAIEQFNDLSDELKMTENRINVARTDYNEIVRDYNILVTTFPARVVAEHYGFKTEAFFELIDKGAERAPKLDMTV